MIRFSHAPDPPAVQFTFLPRNAVQMFTFYVALRFFWHSSNWKKSCFVCRSLFVFFRSEFVHPQVLAVLAATSQFSTSFVVQFAE